MKFAYNHSLSLAKKLIFFRLFCRKIELPRPEFYVFYNGKPKFPKETEMKLSDYFEKLKREDRGMIFGEYSYEDDIRVQRQEAFEDGEIAGAQAKAVEDARNFLKLGVLAETVAQGCSLPLEQVLAIKEELTTAHV